MSGWALLFPGQGAQYVGMGRSVHDQLSPARELFDRANDILGYDLKQICFEGPESTLNSTVHSQPALFVTSLAALELIKDSNPEWIEDCEIAAGLSLGEYTAHVFAGTLDFEVGLKIVQRRGEAMQAASDARPSGMVSVLGLKPDELAQLCDDVRQDEVLAIANYLCPGNIVVSGDKSACSRLVVAAEAAGAMKTISLAVAGAFHTSIMEPAIGALAEVLREAEMRSPRIPVVSNVDARPHDNVDELRELLEQQVSAPVQWEATMRYLLDQNVEHFCEVGPGRVLRGLLKRVHRKADSHGTLD